jgi:GNAT superfamily N-acetyltransferase
VAKRRDLVRAEAMMLNAILHQFRTLGNPSYSDDYVVRFENKGYCQVLAYGNLEGVADEIIEREIAHFRSVGRSFEWKVFGCDRPSDLLDRLIAKGFEVGIKEVVCAVDLATFHLEPSQLFRVEQVVNDTHLHDFRMVAEAVFGKDFSYTAGVLADCLARGTDEEVGFVAYVGKTPVSIGRLDRGEGSIAGGLYTGGTLPEYRGQGAYHAVVAARVARAREVGLRYLWVDARPTSLPILKKVGFVVLVETWPCEWEVS